MSRVTIRDLFWLTVVVALGVAWWLDRGKLKSQIDRFAGGRTWSRDLLELPQTFQMVRRSKPDPSAPARKLPSD